MLMQQLSSHSTQYAAESRRIKREQQTEFSPCHLCSGMVYRVVCRRDYLPCMSGYIGMRKAGGPHRQVELTKWCWVVIELA